MYLNSVRKTNEEDGQKLSKVLEYSKNKSGGISNFAQEEKVPGNPITNHRRSPSSLKIKGNSSLKF